MSQPIEDEFFVGYGASMPTGIAARTRAAIVAYVVMSMVVATVCVAFIARTGKGTWTDSSFQSFRGVLSESPYPVIELDAPIHEGAARTALLVDFGKRGSQHRVLGLDGKRVVATGTVLERDGRCMIELAPEADAIREDEHAKNGRRTERGTRAERSDPTSIRIIGEIVDPKCFLGAMKPGEGKTHKDCAVRCISGGIPPSLVSWDENGQARYFVLTDEQGRAANDVFLNVVGEAVEVTGQLDEIGDLMMIRVARDGIRRL